MLAFLTISAFSIDTLTVNTAPLDFRLPQEAVRSLKPHCQMSNELTVCAHAPNRNTQWRVPSGTLATDTVFKQHVRSLRVQVARCSNSVEDGLRCVKPSPLLRVRFSRPGQQD